MLLVLAAAVPPTAAAEDRGQYIVKRKDSAEPFEVVSASEMRRLNAAGALEWYEPDGVMTLIDDEQTAYYPTDKWDLALIGADAAFQQDHLGQGIRVGVIDSGVSPHPDLKHCLLPGHNYMNGANGDDTSDNYGHGTQVAGLIAGVGSGGYIGAAPGVEIVPLKITDNKTVYVSAVVAAIYGAIDDFGCDVLNLSVGVGSEFKALRDAVDYAESKGVTVVAAVGNGGSSTLYYPAAYESVIGVGGVDRNGTWYNRSNANESVFLTAPGVNVKTTGNLGGYVTATGTSFAVPYVVAAASVLLGIDDTLTPAEIREILAETAEDKDTPGRDDRYGYGLLSVAGSVAAVAGGVYLTPARGAAERVHNPSEKPLECVYYLARYDEAGRLLSVRVFPITLMPDESAVLEPPDPSDGWAQFLCDAQTLAPLTGARRG